MSLNLLDKLDDLDKVRIANYAKLYGCEEYVGNENYLADWANNNKRLYHLLGGELIIEKKVEFKKDYDILWAEIKKLSWDHPFFDLLDDLYYNYCREYKDIFFRDCGLSTIKTEELIQNKYLRKPFILSKKENKKPLKINTGMKLMRALAKVLDYLDADKELRTAFEDMRIKHSMIFNDATLTGILCISIHPLDFMTMSDNASDWSSCMSWTDDGCYRTGTVEMMNSNCVICAYLASDKENMIFDKTKINVPAYTWNNKKWRQLFYCTNDIILGGKAYPYQCKAITKEVLSILRVLAKKNWNVDYDYGIEKYQDMKHINSICRMEKTKDYRRFYPKKHNIVIDTKTMYNDFINAHDIDYWCIRNKVKKNLILNVSGPVPCIRCGDHSVVERYDYDDLDWIDKYEVSEYDDADYNTRYTAPKRLLCKSCITDYQCDICNAVEGVNISSPVIELHNELLLGRRTIKICKSCFFKSLYVCPTCNKPFIYRPLEYANKVIGLHESYDGTPKQLYKAKIDEINLYTRKNVLPNEILIFVECPTCIEKRRGKSTKYNLHWSLEDKYPMGIMTNIYNKRLSQEEFDKYNLDNMIKFTKDDFDTCKNGILTFTELVDLKTKN